MSEPTTDPDGSSPRLRERAAALRGRAEDLRVHASASLDDASGKHPTVRAAVETYHLDRRRFGGMLAGGLAFKLFLWLLPYALVLVSLAGYAASFAQKDPSTLAHDVGLSAALVDVVAGGVQGSGHGRIFLLIIGTVLLVWTGRGLFRSFAMISAAAWGLPIKQARGTLKGSLLLIVVMTAIFALQFAQGWLFSGDYLTDTLGAIVLIAGYTGIWLVLFRALPEPEGVTWTASVPGSVLIAVGTRVLSWVTSTYFARKLSTADDLYGALGLATVFLAWLFLAGRLVVAGTFLNATRWFADHPALDPERP